jgi:hypothetical protein
VAFDFADATSALERAYGDKDTYLNTATFGGLTNATNGIEISGPDMPEKARIMKAFKAASIKVTNVIYTDAPANDARPLNSVGVCVSIGKRS